MPPIFAGSKGPVALASHIGEIPIVCEADQFLIISFPRHWLYHRSLASILQAAPVYQNIVTFLASVSKKDGFISYSR